MSVRARNISNMMEGFESLDSYFLKNPLQPHQQAILQKMLSGMDKYREYQELTNGVFEKPKKDKESLNKLQGYTLRTRGSEELLDREGYYLNRSEIEQFEKTGVLGPYNLLSRQEAQNLYHYSQKLHENNFDNIMMIGDEVSNVLKRNNAWSINYSGIFQALRYQPLWDLLASKEITQRLASLLGEDIICWRSQFFEKQPGAQGTFWHQAATFRETSAKPKLLPTTKIDPGIVQLTAWIALTDVKVKTGCLRMIPGSFMDGRFEQLASDILDNPLSYLRNKDDYEIEKILKTLLFTPGSFMKSQLVFDMATQELEDLFEVGEVEEYEMKAGDFIIFTSLNMHASHPNSTTDETRLAFAGRYTNNDVKVYSGFEHDFFPTPEGNIKFPLDKIGCIQAHGTDNYHFNKIIPYPW